MLCGMFTAIFYGISFFSEINGVHHIHLAFGCRICWTRAAHKLWIRIQAPASCPAVLGHLGPPRMLYLITMSIELQSGEAEACSSSRGPLPLPEQHHAISASHKLRIRACGAIFVVGFWKRTPPRAEPFAPSHIVGDHREDIMNHDTKLCAVEKHTWLEQVQAVRRPRYIARHRPLSCLRAVHLRFPGQVIVCRGTARNNHLIRSCLRVDYDLQKHRSSSIIQWRQFRRSLSDRIQDKYPFSSPELGYIHA